MVLSIKNKNILICPLDWGLGHATRCVPLIRKLKEMGCNLLIAADGRSYEFMKIEFPELTLIRFPGYEVRYPSDDNMVIKMLLQLPALLWGVLQENRRLKKLVRKHNIDLVISDNRFGLWNNAIPSVYITHQITIKCPVSIHWLEPVLYHIHRFVIAKYSECWIPDSPDENNLSGDLSHQRPLPTNTKFIGSLSRFSRVDVPEKKKFNLAVILSGPEPQRTQLEQIILEQLENMNLVSIVIAGKTECNILKEHKGNLTVVSHLKSAEMQEILCSSDVALARSGYSTIMDLAVLGLKAVLVPTPGQTEQEYLAVRLMEKGIYYSTTQNSLNITEAILRAKRYSGIKQKTNDVGWLEETLLNILS